MGEYPRGCGNVCPECGHCMGHGTGELSVCEFCGYEKEGA
jgi:hypothetical protein